MRQDAGRSTHVSLDGPRGTRLLRPWGADTNPLLPHSFLNPKRWISSRIFEGFHEEGREGVCSSDLSRMQPDLRPVRERVLASARPWPCSSELLVLVFGLLVAFSQSSSLSGSYSDSP